MPARQVEVFARSVLRNAESTSASLNKAEDKARAQGRARKPCAALTRREPQLRREIPETVAACQSALDERLPQTLKSVALGDLVERATAALSAHDAQLSAKQEETRRVISRLYEQQERKIAQEAAAQQARRLALQRACCSAHAHAFDLQERHGRERQAALEALELAGQTPADDE